ncbi:hypothetical protein ACFSMW_13425 [Virgibacillus halophilus]|uniref:Uncharacterized protein n=1 Tax=Tigheibacillus halophilus TaxID=361280 RepID=A0ABU5C856_9BACI|nr:hypothetical protein [Virgibacillus halophilus]
MKAICVDATNSNILQEGTEYYVFPHGASAFYVSKFNSSQAHSGVFQRIRFEITEEEKSADEMSHPVQLDIFQFFDDK